MAYKYLRLVFASLLVGVTWGCGGDGGSATGETGGQTLIQNASFQITWPTRSRSPLEHSLSSAQSAMVTVKAATAAGQDVSIAVDRDTTKLDSYIGTYQVGQPIKTSVTSLTATFYASAAEQGAAVGTATAAISPNGSSLVISNILLLGVIKAVAVVNPGSLPLGTQNRQLQFTSLDANGNTVAVSAGSAIWAVTSGGTVLSVSKDGLANALISGTATVTATVDGISSPAATITVASAAVSGAYRLVQIPVPNLTDYALAINASNVVIGSQLGSDTYYHAFTWTQAGGVSQLSAGNFQFGNNDTYGTAINSAGQIVGTGFHSIVVGGHAGYNQPVYWPSSSSAPVEPVQLFGSGNLNAGVTTLLGINNAGAMVGATNTGFVNNTVATYWSSPAANPAALSSGSAAGASAFAINTTGLIVGSLQTTNQAGTPTHACVWANASAQPVTLQELPGGNNSTALAINSSGAIVGAETEASSTHALLWTASTSAPIDLGVLTGDLLSLSNVISINDSGTVVWSTQAGVRIYTTSGGIKDLGTMLDSSGTGYTLQYVDSVNVNSYIVGVAKAPGGSIVPVVLIPNP